MSLRTLHTYLGQLLDAGVNPDIPVVGMSDGWPCEIADVASLKGKYHGDPSPKMSAFDFREGEMLALVPIGEDVSDLINNHSHCEIDLPVEPQSPI